MLLVGGLLALQPLFQGRIAWLADGLLHFHRLAQLDRAILHGNLYPRWLPDMGFGFGFPLFNYYAPLSYYVVEPLLLVGINVSAALMVSFGLALLLCGLGVYLWTRDLFGKTAGLIAALAAVYAPYTLYNAYHRGALAEVWGLAWFPCVLWALHRLAKYKRPRDLLLTAAVFAALVLSHNILAMICAPLLAGYALFLWLLYNKSEPHPSAGRWRRGWTLASALVLGLGLSVFFWGPALFEKDLVQIHQLYGPGDLNYRNNFASLADVLAAPIPADPTMVNPPTPRGLSWPQMLLAATALLGLRRWPRSETRAHLALLAAITLGLVFMTLTISTPVWDWIPLLRFVQFPWRFLGPAGLVLAVLAGAGAARLPGKLWPLVAVLAITLYALPWLFPNRYPSQPDPTPVDLIRWEGESGALGTTSAGDYLPIWVQERPSPDALLPVYQESAPAYVIPRFDETSLPAGATLVRAEYGHDLTTADITFDTSIGFTARFHWYYYPGWQAELDGEPHPLRPEGPHGQVAADIPPGRHRLTVTFGDTPLRRWASVATLVSLVLLLPLAWLARSTKERFPPHVSSAERITGRLRKALVGRQTGDQNVGCRPLGASDREILNMPSVPFILAALVLLVVKAAYLDTHDTPFRRSRFDGNSIAGVQVPLEVNYGNELVLMGYDLVADTVPADGLLEVALYWRVLRPLETDFSIAVHLLDDQGWRYGQRDSQHPARYPTSRWHPGEYARDVHRLAVWPGTSPGLYTLSVGVYDVQTGRQLDLLDANGAPAGTTYPLTRVNVTRSTRPVQPDGLEFAQSLSADMGGGVSLLGTSLQSPTRISAGDQFSFVVFWRAQTDLAADYSARLRLVGSDDSVIAEAQATPGRAGHPTSAWKMGDIVRDHWRFLVPAASPSGDFVLRLDLLDVNGNSLEQGVDLTTVTVHAPERTFDPPSPRYPLDSSLLGRADTGPLTALLGYDLSSEILSPGRTLQVTLYWQAQATAETSYTAFVHLLDATERVLTQRDQVPVGGARPTTGWIAGEIIRDTYELTLPDDLPSGAYRLEVGLYDAATTDRLPILDPGGDAVGIRILLPTKVRVE